MGKVIVLGATGTLGLPMCRFLKENGYDVLAVGHSSNGEELFSKLGIECTKIDIADKSTPRRIQIYYKFLDNGLADGEKPELK